MWPKLRKEHLALAAPFAVPVSKSGEARGVVFFDAGNVILDLDWDDHYAAMRSYLPPHVSFEHFYNEYVRRGLGRAWSVGEIGASQYAASLRQLLSDLGASDIDALSPVQLKQISSLVVGPFRPRVLRTIARLRAAGFIVGLLSNSNVWHEADMERQTPLASHFDVIVFSQDVGCEKPEPAIYAVAEKHAARFVKDRYNQDLSGSQIFFMDDLPENILAARRAGWNAALVTLVNDFVLARAKNNTIDDEEFSALAQKKEHLVFGELAAQRVEALVKELLQ